MKNLKKYWPLLFIFAAFIFALVNTYIHSLRENNTVYNFVIIKTETTPTKTLVFYDKEKKIALWNFKISESSGVRKGDWIYKPKHSDFLYVKRKYDDGIYKIFIEANHTGIFTFNNKNQNPNKKP